MQPTQVLVRYVVLLIATAFVGQMVKFGILSFEQGNTLSPLVMDTVNFYLPLAIPAIASVTHQIYSQFIASRLHDAARQLPAGVPAALVNKEALGDGSKRVAAQFFLGVK